MRKALVVSTILVIIISLNIGCKKYDLDGYNYDVQRSSTSKNIIFFEDNSIIYGIDTLTKSYEVIISVENMDIGGVAKLPSGGIVFTSRGNTNNAIGYGWMYITDNQFNIIKKIDLNGFPEGPAVDGNHILVSVNCISNNSEKVLQIFNSRNYALVKHVTTQTIVYAVDIKEDKLALAETFGAVPINAAGHDPVAEIADLTNGRGVDVALELIGLPATMRQSVQSLAILGRAGIVGLSAQSFPITPYTELLGKEAEIIGVSDHLAQEMPLLIDLVRNGKLNLDGVITEKVSLEAVPINHVLDRLDQFGKGVRAVIQPCE